MSEGTRIIVMLTGLTLILIGSLTFLGFIIFSLAFGSSFVVNFYNPPFANAYILFVAPPNNYIDLPIAIGFLVAGLVMVIQGAKR